jgi:hypothetical protein
VSTGAAVLRAPPPSKRSRGLDAAAAAAEAAELAAAKRRAALVRALTETRDCTSTRRLTPRAARTRWACAR